jgi:hypothetical protein
MPRSETGWGWFDPPPSQSAGQSGLDLARQAARVFGSGDGEALLGHLRDMTLDRCLGPDAGDSALRHLEGQRHLVLHLLGLVARGRAEG